THLQSALQSPVDPAMDLNVLINQFQAAGFQVDYLGISPEATTGDLLRLSGTFTWDSGASFAIGGATGFSYFDQSVHGQLAGSVSATVQPIVLQLGLGVDLVDGVPAFFMADSSRLTISGVNIEGAAGGDFALGSLVDLQADGTVTAALSGVLAFEQSHVDHKLRLSDLASGDAVVGNIDGSVDFHDVTLTPHLALLPDLTWTGDWQANITNNQTTTE